MGPKLFIMYINDICKVSQVFKYILFADDTNLLCCDRDINKLVRMINGIVVIPYNVVIVVVENKFQFNSIQLLEIIFSRLYNSHLVV